MMIVGDYGIEEIREVGRKRNGRVYLFKCYCGNHFETLRSLVKSGHTKSCGCRRKAKDISGFKLGENGEVLKYIETDKHGNDIWEYRCGECNKIYKAHKNRLMGKQAVNSCKNCMRSLAIYYKNRKENINKAFGMLRIIDVLRPKSKNNPLKNLSCALCQCDCGTLFRTSLIRIRNGEARSCGCVGGNKTGKKSPHWKPELTNEDRKYSRAMRWKTLSQKILNRDNYICSICNERGGNLHAHHLDGWNWCIYKRYDKNNIVTLCYNCHEDFHRAYGKGNNTKEQYIEYKQKRKV